MKAARALLVLAMTTSIIVVAYSVAMTAAVGQTLAYGLAAIGAGILALLVLTGFIDADRADDGLFASTLSLLPRTLQKATTSAPRAILISLFLVGLSVLSFWIGPAGLGAVAVACGDAKKIQPVVGTLPVECTTSYTERYWRAEYGLESPGNMGNRERLGFLYDARKVLVDPVSSNMVLASSDLFHTRTGQPARPPFVAAFSVNGRKVLIANTHIVYGRPDARSDRIAELKVIAQNLADHADRSFGSIPAILAGDMNAEHPDGPVISAVEEAGFQTDATLRSAASSVFTDRVYDQIFIREDPTNRLVFGQTGTFNPFEYIMRREDMPLYKSDLARDVDLTRDPRRNMNLYLRWRSGQMSDHQLKWAEFRMDW